MIQMVDECSADWSDVLALTDMFVEGKNKSQVYKQACALSHLKYTKTGGIRALHDARVRYRRWLMRRAWKQYKKKK